MCECVYVWVHLFIGWLCGTSNNIYHQSHRHYGCSSPINTHILIDPLTQQPWTNNNCNLAVAEPTAGALSNRFAKSPSPSWPHCVSTAPARRPHCCAHSFCHASAIRVVFRRRLTSHHLAIPLRGRCQRFQCWPVNRASRSFCSAAN